MMTDTRFKPNESAGGSRRKRDADPIIDVIVPVYKVEPYLRRCVESILAQTFPHFTLILVDDGSPDACGAICDEYAEKDGRVRVIHRKNGGLSAARNEGIDRAFANGSGQWITFVDSDDWIRPDTLAHLYRAAQSNGVSVSVCGYRRTKDTAMSAFYASSAGTEVLSPEAFWCENYVNATTAWGKLYRKELFRKIRYPVGRIHEDEYTTYRILFSQDRIAVVRAPLYCYYQNESGIMQSKWTPAHLNTLDAYERQIAFFSRNGFYDACRFTRRQYLNWCVHRIGELESQTGDASAKKGAGAIRRKLKRFLRRHHRELPVVRTAGPDAEGSGDPLPVAGWRLTEKEIRDATVEWDPDDVRYRDTTAYVIADGTPHTPGFTVRDRNGNAIGPENYDFSYRENVGAGTGYVTVAFKGAFFGSCRGSFKIYLPATARTAVRNAEDGVMLTYDAVKGAAGYVVYRRAWDAAANGWTAFVRWDSTARTTYLDGADASHRVYPGSRYQYGVKAYFARRVDPVTGSEIGGGADDDAGNSNLGFVGPLKTTVRIDARRLISVTGGCGELTAEWDGVGIFTGSDVQIAADAAFSDDLRTVRITDAGACRTVIGDLRAGTTYFVRVRSFCRIDGMTCFGCWSNVLRAATEP